ncbi:MAG: thiamine phosphate synthase [Nitrospirae bacterium]|nr:MAG: thiamine phosphate synthase [Nitrospirota bacterium]
MSNNIVGFKIYLITDRKLFIDEEFFFGAVENALKAGIKAVQLREKDLPVRELLYMAYRMREMTVRYGARLFVNERLDVAVSVDADGVHLGSSGIPVSAARKAVGGKMMIGVSTHSADEALDAQKHGADFITLGPIYPTPSKLKYGKPLGIRLFESAAGTLSIPVFGIGGIKQDKIAEVINAGASGIALISGILGEADAGVAAKKYIETIGAA